MLTLKNTTNAVIKKVSCCVNTTIFKQEKWRVGYDRLISRIKNFKYQNTLFKIYVMSNEITNDKLQFGGK